MQYNENTRGSRLRTENFREQAFFMSQIDPKPFSEPVTVFQERRLPERACPVGYAALIDAYDLRVPLPLTLSAIGERHRITEQGGWRILIAAMLRC
jgi:hypothetical protein